MSERPKEHDWKSCVPRKGTEGSNPSLCAKRRQSADQKTRFFDRVFCIPRVYLRLYGRPRFYGATEEFMEKIASFTVDHTRLQPGLYLSRTDKNGGTAVSTFDLRFVAPNREPVIDMPALHTIEHLGATFLRNSARKEEVVYFGPMGCRTGFYLLMFGELSAQNVLPLVADMCDFILSFEGEIPGARPEECGNWREQNLETAKFYVKKYLGELLNARRTQYPGA